MAFPQKVLLGLILGLFACSTSDSEPVPVPPVDSQTTDDSGQTGSIGPAECVEDADCLPNLRSWLESFESPASIWPQADSGLCSEWGIEEGDKEVQGLACECAGGVTLVGPSGLACSNYGRRLDCIFRGADFKGCDPSDSTSCDAACSEVSARYRADARLTWETEIKLVRCDNLHCYNVFRIGDGCYAQTPNTGQPLATTYDCSLDAESILAQAR